MSKTVFTKDPFCQQFNKYIASSINQPQQSVSILILWWINVSSVYFLCWKNKERDNAGRQFKGAILLLFQVLSLKLIRRRATEGWWY